MGVYIREINENDTANIVRWRNRDFVRKNLYSQELLTEEQHQEYFCKVVQTGKCRQFIIVVENSGMLRDIGTIFIKNIDIHSKKGEYGIFIGEEDAQGKGYAKEATRQILQYAFCELNLNRVYLSVLAENENAIHLYEKSGFQREGILKEEYCRNGEFKDVVVMGITKGNWDNEHN